eukprot:GHVS01083314.1.p1 GENE.GHVS01083314.1~~GHVS01083314.1.p1  ORF type:complete len:507 (+),score=145.95 GHVS01083314.1:70-1521(+)
MALGKVIHTIEAATTAGSQGVTSVGSMIAFGDLELATKDVVDMITKTTTGEMGGADVDISDQQDDAAETAQVKAELQYHKFYSLSLHQQIKAQKPQIIKLQELLNNNNNYNNYNNNDNNNNNNLLLLSPATTTTTGDTCSNYSYDSSLSDIQQQQQLITTTKTTNNRQMLSPLLPSCTFRFTPSEHLSYRQQPISVISPHPAPLRSPLLFSYTPSPTPPQSSRQEEDDTMSFSLPPTTTTSCTPSTPQGFAYPPASHVVVGLTHPLRVVKSSAHTNKTITKWDAAAAAAAAAATSDCRGCELSSDVVEAVCSHTREIMKKNNRMDFELNSMRTEMAKQNQDRLALIVQLEAMKAQALQTETALEATRAELVVAIQQSKKSCSAVTLLRSSYLQWRYLWRGYFTHSRCLLQRTTTEHNTTTQRHAIPGHREQGERTKGASRERTEGERLSPNRGSIGKNDGRKQANERTNRPTPFRASPSPTRV